jgi:hypothetical protein
MAKITGYSKRDQISEDICYGIGYIFGSLFTIFKWGVVGAILTFIGHCILH